MFELRNLDLKLSESICLRKFDRSLYKRSDLRPHVNLPVRLGHENQTSDLLHIIAITRTRFLFRRRIQRH